ncbi:GGDEF domain-containing protein [Methylobacterium aquaticum]|nr:GGDEF domain-containing protein [Methylobacterium aquaticum]
MRAQLNGRQMRAALFRVTEARSRHLLKESHDRLHVMAFTDALTGLRNRKAIGEDLAGLLRDSPVGEALSVAMIDIDDFKHLNDSQGHQAGDRALRAVGSLLLDFSRAHGAACGRIGGEEFLVLMPRTTADDARSRIEVIVQDLDRMDIPNPGSRVADRVTLSAGLVTAATGTAEGGQPELLMRRADIALYDAKKRGRNRIVTATASSEPTAAPGLRELTTLVEHARYRPVPERSAGRRA